MAIVHKKLGMLGLASGSNRYYLDRWHTLFAEKYGSEKECLIEVIETEFPEINQHLPNQFEYLVPILNRYFSMLEKKRITHLLLPNFTIHQTIDHLDSNMYVAHPLKLCIKHLHKLQIKSVYIFGSAYTMQSEYIIESLASEGIVALPPSVGDMKQIDEFRKTVYHENENSDDINHYRALAKKYSDTLPVLIACSELSMYAPHDSNGIIDLADLQIKAII